MGGVYYLVQEVVYDLLLRAWVFDLDGRGISLSSGGGV